MKKLLAPSTSRFPTRHPRRACAIKAKWNWRSALNANDQPPGAVTAPVSKRIEFQITSATTHKPLAKAAVADPNAGPMALKPAPPFPKSADAPVQIQQILDGMSADELRMALTSELDPLRLRLVYRELKGASNW
jgi:hypothetical protein